MILGPILIVDCVVFIIFLIPQLVLHVNILELIQCLLHSAPYLLLQIPIQFVREHLFTSYDRRTPFVQRAPLFEDIVIRCVRHAFAHFPSRIGRVFFSKAVALPFMRFRMLRHGFLRSPVSFTEINDSVHGFRGVWVVSDPSKPVDLVVMYLHGGGFSMGSAYFYLEFLMAWLDLLRQRWRGVRNPAVFALEYSLVPDRTFPTQVREARAAYDWVLSKVLGGEGKRIVVAGDSAGATLVLSLLLVLAGENDNDENKAAQQVQKPGFATLLSPWCVLVSPQNRNTPSDYLDAETLHTYARQYVSDLPPSNPQNHANNASTITKTTRKSNLDSPIASPGLTTSPTLWRRASPIHGFHFVYGSEEVLAPDARTMVKRLRGAVSDTDVDVVVTEEEGGIHAWPVVDLFLKGDGEAGGRLRGLRGIVEVLGGRMGLGEGEEW